MPWNIINSVKTVTNTKKPERSWIATGNATNGIRLATSTNGTTWSAITDVSNVFYYDVAYGNDDLSNGLWIVAGGDSTTNSLLTSSNRTTWTPVTSPLTSAGGGGVAYGKDGSGTGLWVAVGTGGNTIVNSSNGTNWTNASTNVFTSGSGSKVAYGKNTAGNGLWIAVGGNAIARSTNGTVWSVITQTILSSIRNITYGIDGTGTGLWVAVGVGSSDSIASSSDGGVTWNGRGGKTNMFTDAGSDVFYANNLWIAVGSSAKAILRSTNGINWSNVTTPVLTSGASVRYGKDNLGTGLWVATGNDSGGSSNNAFVSSTDGNTWNANGGYSGLFNNGGGISVAFSEIIVPP